MTGLVSDYSLVNFMPLTVKSKEMMLAVSKAIDKANGYCFTSVEEANAQRTMAFSNNDFEYTKFQEVRESFMNINASTSESDVDDDSPSIAPRIKKSKQGREKIGNDLDKIDINAPNIYGMTSLHIISQLGHTKIAKMLMNNSMEVKIGVNFPALRGQTAFHMACEKGHLNVVEILMNKSQELGMNLNAQDDYGRTAFHLACLNDHLDVAQFLIERSGDSI